MRPPEGESCSNQSCLCQDDARCTFHISLACTTSLHDLARSSRDLTLNHKATYGKGNCPVGSAPTASGWKLSSTNCCPRWATRKAWSSSSLSDSAAVFRTHICCAFDSWYLIDTKMTKPKIYACTLHFPGPHKQTGLVRERRQGLLLYSYSCSYYYCHCDG